MTADQFISRLDKVKATRKGWLSICPGHADKSPSLSIAEGDDGKILLRCFAGCTAEEITAAMGLSLRDLFSGNDKSPEEIRRDRERRTEKLLRESREREQDGLVIDACREAEVFIRSRQGLDISGWSNQTLDDELNALADAYLLLEKEGLDGIERVCHLQKSE